MQHHTASNTFFTKKWNNFSIIATASFKKCSVIFEEIYFKRKQNKNLYALNWQFGYWSHVFQASAMHGGIISPYWVSFSTVVHFGTWLRFYIYFVKNVAINLFRVNLVQKSDLLQTTWNLGHAICWLWFWHFFSICFPCNFFFGKIGSWISYSQN